MRKPFISKIIIVSLILLLTGCKTLKQPESVPKPLNYSDENIVQNEIERINNFMEKEPVRGFWRSLLLGNEEIINSSLQILNDKLEDAILNGNYVLAEKYFKSIISAGYHPDKYEKSDIDNLLKSDVPGLSKNNDNAPESIEDCINATCTIWVDRGVKVERGAGYADIIIGSGFFIDVRGYLVTNYHVIESMVNPKYEGFSRLYIKLPADMDNKIPAKVIGYDEKLDLALLKVEIEPEYVFSLGSSQGLRVGDKVSAIGTPVGLEGTLTSGIISATDRKLLTLGNVFQIDAAVNSGNSGGPLIDQNMNVQAVVFAGVLQSQGLNFAIPVEYLIQELRTMYTEGEVIHPWIGAYGKSKKNGAKKLGLEIHYVMPGSPSFMSGLKAGDVIIELDGKKITCLEDFQYVMLAYKPETVLTCKYLDSDNEVNECLIYLDVRPNAPAKDFYNTDYITGSFIPLFGMKLASSSTINKKSFTITEVFNNTTADELSFSPNDIIEIRDVFFDDESEVISAHVYTKRQKKGFLDITMVLGTQYDSPYYF